MKKGIKKAISTIAILTMTFQIGMPMVPGLQTIVLATDTINPVEENIQPTTDKEGTMELSESVDITPTEEISRNYEIKEEETWDISVNGDGSVIAKWTLKDRTLTIYGTGEMKDWERDSVEDWHDTQYTTLIQKAIIEEGITRIGDHAFEECSSLENINISDSVTSIGFSAFSECSSLTSITIPEGVTSIEEYAFYECSRLESIDIPKGVTSIEYSAFSGCSRLESIDIPEGVTSIGYGTFSGCSRLESIDIPEGVTSIGYSAFSGCSSLTSIIIPESVTSIGSGAFRGCSSLEGINVDENNTEYISENGILFNKEKTEIICYPAGKKDIKEYMIPEGVTSIEDRAFSECSSLTSITIPEGVTSIEDRAFSGCSSLTSINIPEGVTSIGYTVFYGCSSLTSIIIPEGVTSIEDRAFYECSSLTSINIPQSVTTIGSAVFQGCDSLVIYVKADTEGHRYVEKTKKGYILEGDATNIDTTYRIQGEETWDISINQDGSVMARWTLSDKTLTISGTGEMKDWEEDSVEDWHDTQYTNLIQRVIIKEGIKRIENHAFKECNSLESIDIAESVTSIGEDAFYECSSLTSITIPEGVTSIGEYAFRGCSSLTSINIPDSVTSIGYMAFSNCSSLESIEIPEGVTSIAYVFDGCSSLERINVDENNTNYISENGILFNKEKTEIICYPAGKKDIKEYIIPESVTSIKNSAFCKCRSLTSINIPEGVTSIEYMVFYGCSSLTSITIPESVTSIDDSAFEYCTSLESIEIPEGVTSIGKYAFRGCSSLTSITIPESVTSITESYTIPKSTIIYTKSNSEGHRYAEENEQGYIVDDIAPTITFTPNAGENIQKQYTVTVEVEDDVEEVGVNENNLKYQWTQSETQPTKESFTESFENGQAITKNTGDGAWYLWIYAEDNVGNETITRSEAFHFDNTAPNVNVEYSTKNSTKENVKVTITSNEEMQTVQGWTLSSNKKTLTKEYSANTKETIIVKDLAGNEKKATIEITNIDKVAPILDVTYSTKNPTRENVKVTITSNEEIQSVTGWTLSNDKKTLTKEYTENTTETITVKDLVGNETQVNVEISNIDKNLPEITIGDINQDGKIDVTDLLMLKRHLVAGNRSDWKLTGDSLLSADMNENGTVDITDMLMLKRVIVENI